MPIKAEELLTQESESQIEYYEILGDLTVG